MQACPTILVYDLIDEMLMVRTEQVCISANSLISLLSPQLSSRILVDQRPFSSFMYPRESSLSLSLSLSSRSSLRCLLRVGQPYTLEELTTALRILLWSIVNEGGIP